VRLVDAKSGRVVRERYDYERGADGMASLDGVPALGRGAKARKAREDRLRALTTEPPREFEALPTMSPNPMPAFSLYSKPRRRGVDDSARARNVDAIIAWARQDR
jgi:hypothetical protein